jgi:hypothetical protein
MMRYVAATLLVFSTLAHARESNSPLIRDSAPQDPFVSGFVKSCVKEGLKKRESKLISDNLIRKICDCSARETFDLLNAQDVDLMVGGKMPKTIEQKLDKAMDICVQRMFPTSE